MLRLGPSARHILPIFREVTTKCVMRTFPRYVKRVSFSRYMVPEKTSLPKDLQKIIDDTEKKVGFIPNVYSTLSHRPEELRLFLNYYDHVMAEKPEGKLTKADKEMIVVATSAENKCLYCVIAHGALLRIYSKNPILADQLAVNWQKADIDDRQRAILEFAVELCHCRTPTSSHFKALEQNGLSEEDAWDIGAVVALFAMSNRYAFLTDMKPNQEFYMFGRIKREK